MATHRLQHLFPILAQIGMTLCLFFAIQTMAAPALEYQRELYQDAKKALRKGDITTFTKLSDSLRDYPLYPYLRYNYLQPRLQKVDPAELEAFTKEFPDFPLTDTLRVQWLKHLARTHQWQTYYENYTPQEDKSLQCSQLIARMETNHHTLLLEDIRSAWLSGSSLPPDCDPAFKRLYQSDLFTNDLVWQRIQLAMERNNTSLANHLSHHLDAEHKNWVKLWIAVHNDPDKLTRNPQIEDTPVGRQILVHGVKRLAGLKLKKAIERWDELLSQFDFVPGERTAIDRLLAVRAAETRHPRADELLDRVAAFDVDTEVLHWRLLTAFENLDWQKLRRWTDGVPANEDIKYRWFYWHARALEQTGDVEKSARIYSSIANKRDYYGFLAADRLNIGYSMEHKPLPDIPEEKEKIARLPGVLRAEELRAIGEKSQARREWQYALLQMTAYQKEVAARFAADRGWHDVAIISLGSAHSYDDLEVRFPIPYESLISGSAKKRALDPGWVYALVRSESAFMEDIKSPAGAMGLMQVMPQTGKATAKSMGMKNYKTEYLLEAEINIPIGSTYLKQMLNKFNGNMILATAAYNAGPHRVKSWLPKSGCMDPDIWVEQIPFDETRTYVRRVMFFASIYDWRLRREVMPLRQRMASVAGDALVAGLGCTGQALSYN